MFRLARDALATRDLRRLQFASLAAGIGGWAFMVSLAVHAYAVGGAAAVGLAAFVRMAPAGLAAPLTGLAADRFPRRDVLLAATLTRAALLGAGTLAVALDAPFALLLVLATLFTVAATAHKPAQAALLPHLAPSRTRQAASNALWTAIDNGAFVVGAMAGGLLVAALGTAPAFAAAGFAFAVAALALARIPREQAKSRGAGPGWRPRRGEGAAGEPRRPEAVGREPRGRVGETVGREPRGRWASGGREPRRRRVIAAAANDALAGLRVVTRDRRLRLLVGVLSASTFVEGMVDVLVVVIALKLVALGDAGVGWLNAAWGIGGLLGGAAALKLLVHDQLGLALPAGGILIGAPLLLLAGLPSAPAALVALTVLGVGYALTEIGRHHAHAAPRPRRRPRPRVRRDRELLLADDGRRGALLAPAIVALAGPRGALLVVGAALPIIVLTRGAALRRLAPAATGGRPAAASAPVRLVRAGARNPAAAPDARPATPLARQS